MPLFLAACMKCVDSYMWLAFILFHDTRRGENLFHTPTSITKQLRIEAILRQMEMLMVTAHKKESHI